MRRCRLIKVLLLVDTLGSGGAEKMVVDIATHLDRLRFQVHVCVTRSDGSYRQQLDAAGIPTFVLGRRYRFEVHKFLSLLALLYRQRIDILHSHKFGSNVWGVLLGKLARVPIIIAHEHMSPMDYDKDPALNPQVRKLVTRSLATLADGIVTVSDADKNAFARLGVSPSKLVTIYPGRELADFDVALSGNLPEDTRTGLSIDVKSPVVTVVARLVPQKGLDVFLRAAAQVSKSFTEVRFLVVGDGPLKNELERQSEAMGLSDQCIFTGFRRDIPVIFSVSQIAVLSSVFESLPAVAIEAMAARCPVVATRVGGVPEIVIDGKTGFLVPSGDPDCMAQAILKLLREPELARRMGEAGRRVAEKRFSMAAMIQQIETLYESLLVRKLGGRQLYSVRTEQ